MEARGLNSSGSNNGNGLWIDRGGGGGSSTNGSNVNTLDTKSDPSTEKLLGMTNIAPAEYAEVFGPAPVKAIPQTPQEMVEQQQQQQQQPQNGASSPLQQHIQPGTPVAYATTSIVRGGRNVSNINKIGYYVRSCNIYESNKGFEVN